MPRRSKQPTPRGRKQDQKKDPRKPKILAQNNVLVKSIRNVTAKKTPSKNVVEKFKRTSATKRISAAKAQEVAATAFKARSRAFIKQANLISTKKIKPKSTNTTARAKVNSIKSIAQAKALTVVNKFKQRAIQEKIKNNVKLQQKLRNLQTASDERTLPTRKLEIAENGTMASKKYNFSISKLKQTIANGNLQKMKKNHHLIRWTA